MHKHTIVRVIIGVLCTIVAVTASIVLFLIYAGMGISSAHSVLPIPVLMFITYIGYRILVLMPNRFNIILLLGFFVHLVGDILFVLAIELSNTNVLYGGYGTYLVGHILNLIAFSIPAFADFPHPPKRFLFAIPFSLYGVLIFLLILFLGDVSMWINIGVAVYAAISTTSAWRVASRYRYLNESKVYSLFSIFGYILLLISDSFNGLGRFGVINFNSLVTRELVVLLNYWVGLGLLAFSVDLTGAPQDDDIELHLGTTS